MPNRRQWTVIGALAFVALCLLFMWLMERAASDRAQTEQSRAAVATADLNETTKATQPLANRVIALCARTGNKADQLRAAGVCPLAERAAEVVQTIPGPAGEPGEDGAQGEPGVAGPSGPPGPPGLPGDDGEPGADGQPGADGSPGATGSTGATGERGIRGETGQNGQTGPQGPAGERGAQGEPGQPGEPGRDGANGLDGAPGRGIASVACNDDGLFVVIYTDGAEQIVENSLCRVGLLDP